ncbi:MAG: SAM-dependent chlorinase/fluorinase [Deltaproteobacteria bacterium]|nr:SAM-dependent chlorinase/fluorinase [Deltaproteobacteria bacterium]MBW2070351.1 SAM-dependent chlorinase/fluorinase [Deltaproteobacteria bacterium]
MARIVTLLTDFGTRDHYVAAVKGTLLRINPQIRLVDITHEIAAHNIVQGGFVLASSFHCFPPQTIHLAVVDPGVGGKRRGLAAVSGQFFFVGPDNGIFDLVFALEPPRRVVALENSSYWLPRVSATFHARDIFAPVAGHLSLGLPLARLGSEFPYRGTSPLAMLSREQQEVKGQVLHIDRFGNLISNILCPADFPAEELVHWEVRVADRPVLTGPLTYEQAPLAEPFALKGSCGYLEVAVRNGEAARLLGQGIGAAIVVRRKKTVRY